MEPLAVLSLVSNLAQIIDLARSIIETGSEVAKHGCVSKPCIFSSRFGHHFLRLWHYLRPISLLRAQRVVSQRAVQLILARQSPTLELVFVSEASHSLQDLTNVVSACMQVD